MAHGLPPPPGSPGQTSLIDPCTLFPRQSSSQHSPCLSTRRQRECKRLPSDLPGLRCRECCWSPGPVRLALPCASRGLLTGASAGASRQALWVPLSGCPALGEGRRDGSGARMGESWPPSSYGSNRIPASSRSNRQEFHPD